MENMKLSSYIATAKESHGENLPLAPPFEHSGKQSARLQLNQFKDGGAGMLPRTQQFLAMKGRIRSITR